MSEQNDPLDQLTPENRIKYENYKREDQLTADLLHGIVAMAKMLRGRDIFGLEGKGALDSFQQSEDIQWLMDHTGVAGWDDPIDPAD
jgi:hypothetical protein